VTADREKRAKEKIIKHGETSVKSVSPTTIKEIGTLRKFLRFARTKGYADRVTKFEMEPEGYRNRTLATDEYYKLLEKSPAWLRRVIVMAWETALSRFDLFRLTWAEIDLRESIIELKNSRAKTGKPRKLCRSTLQNSKRCSRSCKPNGAGCRTSTDSCSPWTESRSTN
jgi:integrase